jgi:tetratricopeptide (TPR) repeat protein
MSSPNSFRALITPFLALALIALVLPEQAAAQRSVPRIDVDSVTIEAEIEPNGSDLLAKASVAFTVVDEEIRFAVFELHNEMEVDGVTDSDGEELRYDRSRDLFTVRVDFIEPLLKGDYETVTFSYAGRLTGREESPIWGINFASIGGDYSYLMYPARWFPISGYTTDRFTSDFKITVPSGYKVLGSGIVTNEPSEDGGVTYNLEFSQPSFPGSIAVVSQEPQIIESEGINTTFYFRDEATNMASSYGREMGRVMGFLSDLYGIPPESGLTVVETEEGTPNGYSAPGMLFVSTPAIGDEVDMRLLVNQMARQYWGNLVSPATRNHLWLVNGMARYTELLWVEDTEGPTATDPEMRENYVEALTVQDIPLIQTSRLEDYSPEFWASTAGKGSAVLNMLRQIVGDDAFAPTLKKFLEAYAWKSFYTDDFRKVVEEATGRNLQGFFIQWIESSGAPEFDMEYTVYRTQQGFRIIGKVIQDLDTFRMPVKLLIETEGNPEEKTIEVVGASSEFVLETFGKPKKLTIDPDGDVLRYSDTMRVAVAIRRGEQYAEIGEFMDALKEYQKALDVNRYSSLAHYRVAEVFFLQRNYQSAANEFREAINGDQEPEWTIVWAHINLGKVFDVTGQRERAVNEYNRALRTRDDTQGAQEEASRYLQQPYERERSDN